MGMAHLIARSESVFYLLFGRILCGHYLHEDLGHKRRNRRRMRVFTGSFSKVHLYPHPIAIVRSLKFEWPHQIAGWLAPGQWLWDWKKLTTTNKEKIDAYVKLYLEFTLYEAPEIIYERLAKLSNNEDCTLICYERSPKTPRVASLYDLTVGIDFCHRHIVSAFLRTIGVESYEWC
jgi:hypothetical protein